MEDLKRRVNELIKAREWRRELERKIEQEIYRRNTQYADIDRKLEDMIEEELRYGARSELRCIEVVQMPDSRAAISLWKKRDLGYSLRIHYLVRGFKEPHKRYNDYSISMPTPKIEGNDTLELVRTPDNYRPDGVTVSWLRNNELVDKLFIKM